MKDWAGCASGGRRRRRCFTPCAEAVAAGGGEGRTPAAQVCNRALGGGGGSGGGGRGERGGIEGECTADGEQQGKGRDRLRHGGGVGVRRKVGWRKRWGQEGGGRKGLTLFAGVTEVRVSVTA